MKPLNKKAYGSIPHLIGSKVGPGDHTVHEGQHRICTEKTRDKNDIIIVQEKYDGSNVAIANVDGVIIPIVRAGYTALSSPHEQHIYFHHWVMERLSVFDFIKPGDRLCGEWMLQAHGIMYDIGSTPFVAFDYFSGDKRITFDAFIAKLENSDIKTPRLLFYGNEAVSIYNALDKLYDNSHAEYPIAHGKPEGVVYRVERAGKVDFLAKYVRDDFIPGKYFEENGNSYVMNFCDEDFDIEIK